MSAIGRAARIAVVAFAAGAAGAAAVVAGNALRRRLLGAKAGAPKLGDPPADPVVEDAVEVPRR